MRTRVLLPVLSLFIACGFFMATQTTEASAYGHGVHCVRYGETLHGIAWRYGVSSYTLAHHNGIYNPNYIRAGQCLRIPSAGYHKPAPKKHYAPAPPKKHHYTPPKKHHAPKYHAPKKHHGGRYCVSYGETLYSIAWRHGVSVWSIAKANGIYNPNHIRAGQCLYIPRY